MKKNKISIYVKDMFYNPSSYYRIIQYCNKMDDEFDFIYHPQLLQYEYESLMPISTKSILTKIRIEVVIFFRQLKALHNDYNNEVDVLVISRRIINRFFPILFKWYLNRIKNHGTKIIWDFDDHIIKSKEVTKFGFNYLSKLSDTIIVTHDYLKSLIKFDYQKKVILLPTTDGDIYTRYNPSVLYNRLDKLSKEIILIWIGTSGNLKYIEPIIEPLDRIGQNYNRRLVLKIVSDGQINYITNNLIVENIKWSREIAVKSIMQSHIGLMPLTESDFAKGKGAFKLIQYLSGALPIIGSNVGFNKVVCTKDVGLLVNDFSDFQELKSAIDILIQTPEKWSLFSNNAIKKWKEDYNFDLQLQFWGRLFQKES